MTLVALGLLLVTSAAQATPVSCPVVDLVPAYQEVLDRSRSDSVAARAAAVRREFLAHHPGLYRPEVFGLDSRARLDDLVLESLRSASKRAIPAETTVQVLRERLATTLSRFQASFPDFKCSFTIYLMPSFGAFDGAGRLVDAAPALVLGVDTIAASEPVDGLGVFLSHEVFHRYHFQAAGFSDDENNREVLWKALWAEGLATYVSVRLNPERPLADAWLLPRDLDARTSPHVPEIATALRANLDLVAPKVFGKYFVYGNLSAKAAGLPWRSGYFIGYLVAEHLAKSHSLEELAHLRGAALRTQIAAVLDELAAGK